MSRTVTPAERLSPVDGTEPSPAIELIGISRRFDTVQALDAVTLTVGRGEIHAILGPNGAGKTTLLRIAVGLVRPDAGTIRLDGRQVTAPFSRSSRSRFATVPSGDRTFYLRLTGLENLAFFARLYGLGRRQALERARRCLAAVDLLDAGGLRVGTYSHGMQKRLSIARSLLTDPPLLLFDEATHDLDPSSARRVRDLVRRAAERGAGVVWTTQRVEEIRGFCDRVTVLRRGTVRFDDTVPALISRGISHRYVIQLRPHGSRIADVPGAVSRAVAGLATISPEAGGDGDQYLLAVKDGVPLGDAIAALSGAGIAVVACRHAGSEIEDAFLALTEEVP
ncbi:MAG TPA: ABC transporter ATP-binding protein [Actinomycetota bacterium]